MSLARSSRPLFSTTYGDQGHGTLAPYRESAVVGPGRGPDSCAETAVLGRPIILYLVFLGVFRRLGEDRVDEAVFFGFLGAQEEIAVRVFGDRARWTGPVCFARISFSISRLRRISRAWISMSLTCPPTPPYGWCIMIRAWGRANRLPFVPPANSTAAPLAARPTQ